MMRTIKLKKVQKIYIVLGLLIVYSMPVVFLIDSVGWFMFIMALLPFMSLVAGIIFLVYNIVVAKKKMYYFLALGILSAWIMQTLLLLSAPLLKAPVPR